MYNEGRDEFYYLTAYNENYAQPAISAANDEGILRGIYLASPANKTAPKKSRSKSTLTVHLLGSGSIMQQVLEAQQILADRGISADVYSVTSYSQLYRDAIECDEWNRAHENETPRQPYISRVLSECSGRFVAATDFMTVLPASVAKWIPGELVCLGTDGYGLSESRPVLRDHFGVSAEQIAQAASQ
jgi:pyruvate dehydrogenase E1 component